MEVQSVMKLPSYPPRAMPGHRFLLTVAAMVCLLTAGGCARFGDFARNRADRAAYGAVRAKQKEAGLTSALPFSIQAARDEATSRLLTQAGRIGLGQDTFTTPTYTLSLADTLAVALANSRDYQTRKESLFSKALDLTKTRYDFGVQESGSASGDLTRTETGHGTQSGATMEVFGKYGLAAGVRKVFATGAQVSLDYTHDFLRYLTNAPRPSAQNSVSLSVVQPLLRGAGPLVAFEELRQAERDMIYEVRDFKRYQQDFVISVAERYYDLLRARDRMANANSNLRSANDNWDQIKLLRDAGIRADLEVDQAWQRVLEARTFKTDAEASYMSQLDGFKVFLGVPLETDLGPDQKELQAVAARGLLRPDMKLEDAVNTALQERLDLKTSEDRVADSERKVRIALWDFLPSLDFSYTFNTSRTDRADEFSLKPRNNTHEMGLGLDLPLDWVPRRNNYRLALIAFEAAKRAHQQDRDNAILEVRDGWRQIERLRQNYEIQVESVRLAKRRVDSTQMFLQANRASARDVLEAQDALLTSQNALTDALVNHTIQRLRFWTAIERLQIDPKGMWYE